MDQAGKVEYRTAQRCRPKATPVHHIRIGRVGHDRLDGLEENVFEAMQADSGPPCENCRRMPAEAYGLEFQDRSLRDSRPYVDPASEAVPARPFPMPSLEPRPLGFSHREPSPFEPRP